MSTLAVVLAAALLAQAAAPAPRTLDKSDVSRIDSPLRVVLRSEAEWVTFWQRHAAARPRPGVSFGRDMVVVACLGSRPTSGYGVEIVRVGVDQGAPLVGVRESSPPADAMTAQMLTAPCHIVAVPSVPGTARFELLK